MTSAPYTYLSLALFSSLAALACSGEGDGDLGDTGSGAAAGSGGQVGGVGGMSGDSGGSNSGGGPTGDSGGTDGSGGGETTGPSACGSGDMPFRVPAAVANNYTFTSELNLSLQIVAANTFLDFEWGALTTSFTDQPVDPTMDLGKVDMVVFPMTPEELATAFNDNEDLANVGAAGISYNPTMGETTANLLDFQSFGSPLNPEDLEPFLDPEVHPPATTTYALLATTDDGTIGVGTQMIQAFQLDVNATETLITMTDESTSLVWTADLSTSAPTMIPAGQASIMMDWTDIPTTSFGTEFAEGSITEVLIARYDLTVAEIEADFLHIENIATELYRGPVPFGSSIDLGTLTDEAGSPFPGLGGEGVWLVGLMCPTCLNPTPWYVSVVEACP